MDEKLRIVHPYGILSCGLEQYFLLSPVPVPGDNWEHDGTYRFVGVPVTSAAIEEKGTEVYNVYGYARHIVTNSFTIEYQYDMEEIHIPILDEINLTTMEAQYDKEK